MQTLILVHKTHLDIGFTDLAGTVTRQYLDDFIPAAIERAAEMNGDPANPRFVWTTGAWIIWKALNSYDPGRRQALIEAIEKGWIAWHALPFTFHTELLTPTLLRLSLKFGQWLDAEFGKTTLSAKMTDVPGHTIGLVPVLAEAGIRFLHLGVNPASRVPDVPECFRWRCGDAGIIVNYARTYGAVSQVPGCPTGLSFLHTNDNLGPPSREAIEQEENYLKTRFKPDTIRSGTIDDFTRELLPLASSLPVVDTEIGDSWIHGIASDPRKLAAYAALRRSVDSASGELLDQPLDRIASWLEPLLLVPEHTWGLDVKAWFGDHRHYRPTELETIRRSHRFRNLVHSWQEQRAYLTEAEANLPEPEVRPPAGIHERPVLSGPSRPFDLSAGLSAGRWALRFEPATACLSGVYDTETGRELCPSSGRLGWGIIQYELYGSEDYNAFLARYMGPPPYPWWAVEDFTKIGLPTELNHGRIATIRFAGGQVQTGADWTEVFTDIQFLGDPLVLEGTPGDLAVSWKFHHTEPRIDVRIGWSRKPATRMPESCWFGFRLPAGIESVSYRKLGQWIDPASVVKGGGCALHAIEDKVRYGMGDRRLEIHSPDALLAAPDCPRLLTVPDKAPAGREAVWFNLFNNIWNTNFPQWTEGPMGYRFSLVLHQGG